MYFGTTTEIVFNDSSLNVESLGDNTHQSAPWYLFLWCWCRDTSVSAYLLINLNVVIFCGCSSIILIIDNNIT